MLVQGSLYYNHRILPYAMKPKNLTFRLFGKLFKSHDIGVHQCPLGWSRELFKKDFNIHSDLKYSSQTCH